MKSGRRLLVVSVFAMCALGACQRQDKAAPPAPVPAQPAPPAKMTPTTPSPPVPVADDPWSKQQQPLKKDPLPHPLFWSAEKDGHTTYFLGTIHLGVDPETRLPDLIWKDLDAAPAFAMETDLEDASLMNSFKRTSGTLHEELGPEYWKKLEEALTPAVARGIDDMKAMVPASVLSMRGMPQTAPMDGILVEHAKHEKKRVIYLEPASAELAVLDKWMDARALKAMLDDNDGVQRQKDLLDAYLAGDDKKMIALSEDERALALKQGYTGAEYDQEMEDLLYHRNASWIPEIEQLHAAGGGFVAVGAMHLLGKRSVLDLLAAKGYKITRVTP